MGAGRSACVQKKTCLSLSLSLLRPGGDRPGQLLGGAGARPDRAAHRHACGLQGREGTPGIDAEKKERREKRRNLQVGKERKEGVASAARLLGSSLISFFLQSFFSCAPPRAPTHSHPPTHPPTPHLTRWPIGESTSRRARARPHAPSRRPRLSCVPSSTHTTRLQLSHTTRPCPPLFPFQCRRPLGGQRPRRPRLRPRRIGFLHPSWPQQPGDGHRCGRR